jgi:hypothetical protein
MNDPEQPPSKPLLYGPDNKPLPQQMVNDGQEKLAPKARQDTPTPTRKGIKAHKKLIAWLLGIATLLGGATVVLPRPTVMQTDPVDPSNPFSASFTITNTTIIPLHHVNAYFALGGITTAPLKFMPFPSPHLQERAARLNKPEWIDHTLGMDERFTITPGDIFSPPIGGSIDGAEFGIVVQYRPWILPWKREKTFVFVTHRQSNGQLYWYSIPDR